MNSSSSSTTTMNKLSAPYSDVPLLYAVSLEEAEIHLSRTMSRITSNNVKDVGFDVEAVVGDLCLVQICDGHSVLLIHIAMMEGKRSIKTVASGNFIPFR